MRIEQEAREGLTVYRNNLVGAFADTEISVDPDRIRGAMAAEGIVSNSPIVTIPYTTEALEKAVGIKNTSAWIEPFTANAIEEARDKRERLDNGESTYDVGLPRVFYSSMLDIAVVIDDSNVNTEEWGEVFAKGIFVSGFAHEAAHSAFARLNQLTLTPIEGTDKLHAEDKGGISQFVVEETLEPGGGTETEYEPVWIDEAFAVYMAARVRSSVHPESIPAKPRKFVGDEFTTPTHYLVLSEDCPEEPGDIGGPAAGLGLEVLETKRPGSIDRIKQLAQGKLTIEEYHRMLKNDVGAELYSDITERRPEATWGTIFKRIQAL